MDSFVIRMPNGLLWGVWGGELSTFQYLTPQRKQWAGPYTFPSAIQADTALEQLRAAASRCGIPFKSAAVEPHQTA